MYGNFIDISGQKFGRLLVLFSLDERKHGNIQWWCRCDCGKELAVVSYSLRSGRTKSCGCIQDDWTKTGKASKTHGHASGKKSSEYNIWINIKQRCSDRSNKNYGGRGITVCDEWLNSFEKFYRDMGPRTSNKHSIDRINNDGNYEPDNCRWAVWSEQMLNRRPYGKSKYRYVVWDEKNKRWVARPTINGIRKYVGYFDTEDQAHDAVIKCLGSTK